MPDEIDILKKLLKTSRRIVFLTGAGMSTESGIPDFRSAGGLYSKNLGEEIFDIRNFDRNPSLFYKYARQLFQHARVARPNAGHRAIAALEHQFGKEIIVTTQNIDTLHQKAGSTTVYPVHGAMDKCTCRNCGETVTAKQVWKRVDKGDIPPRHRQCGGVFKPAIVFFGEDLPGASLKASEDAISNAELLIVAGTSLVVQPVASLPLKRHPDCRLIIINRTPTDLDPEAELLIRAPVGQTLNQAVRRLA